MNHYEDKFFLAVATQDHETIERLIDKDVDVNARNGNALSVASNQGDYLTVQMLLQAGAEATADKSKALRMAAQAGHKEVVELLIDYGADNFDAAIKAAAKKKKALALSALIFKAHADEQSQFKEISRNQNLSQTIQSILNENNDVDLETLLSLMTADDIDAIEEITPTDLKERIQNKKFRI
ncbi:ankyrin repeat domain-containing protein [Achromobacter sp. MY14]|uniref:ankyrin repeat domain-containing protein n=1 Tax=unclassified Achromobacter TaxID=2626865 RepID=UPI001E41A4C0|nr:ankyrin repeat domain-containing protein [Achromobacter sp. MY14]MCD0496767.1 ankyrin repeat domain-containing protein [Achromobacter sp. MY14]